MIPEALEGKRIGVTGATGFLGTALVERLLRCVPGCTVAVLVRPGRRVGAAERTAREIVRNDCFDRLRAEWGDAFDARIAERLSTIPGDVAVDGLGLDEDGRAALGRCDIVVHSAATVSFDAALDAAVEVNLLGPSRVAQAIAAASELRPGGAGSVHLVAVSTAYVAGGHRGRAPEVPPMEQPFHLDIDWRQEVVSARRTREDAEAGSRTPERLRAFRTAALGEIGAAGRPLIAAKAESLRRDWVKNRLVEAGRARAQGLGWPDAYAYTKSLGEQALIDTCGDVPVTIVRPSIIESALSEPVAGWIRGFRMAEPVIISYARGLLAEFPGVPEGTVDVIPVDFVVAALLAVAAGGPAPDGPSVYQCASGERNPLRYGRLVDLAREWFLAHPLYDSDGQPIVVPEWSFPGRGRVQSQLLRATRALRAAEATLSRLPVRGTRAELGGALEARRAQAERALSYVELYGAYTECEAVYSVDRLLSLWGSLGAQDREAFAFDPALIDWRHYVHDVHLPSIVSQARVRTSPGRRTGPDRHKRALGAILAPGRRLAAFDLEHTLVASNVVDAFAWLATRHLDGPDRLWQSAKLVAAAPRLLAQDRRDRGDFLRSFYRRYAGADPAELARDATELFSDLLLAKAFPAGIARVREHRRLGHHTLLITGALDFVVEPMRPLFDEVICASLSLRDGRLTGELASAPPTGEARALAIAEYAAAHDLDLAHSIAYADSSSDLPMLEAVGHPVAVNPEVKLATIARRRGWHVEHWPKAPGGPRPLLPIGPPPAPGVTGPWRGAAISVGQAAASAARDAIRGRARVAAR